MTFGQAVFDCMNVNAAVNRNEVLVRRVMRYSGQPEARTKPVRELVEDFGLWRVAKSLNGSAALAGSVSVLENPDPRIVSCVDNVHNRLCSSLVRGKSSEGSSLLFNSKFDSSDDGDSAASARYFAPRRILLNGAG